MVGLDKVCCSVGWKCTLVVLTIDVTKKYRLCCSLTYDSVLNRMCYKKEKKRKEKKYHIQRFLENYHTREVVTP